MLPNLSLFPCSSLGLSHPAQLLEEAGDIFCGFLCGEVTFIESKIGHFIYYLVKSISKENILAIIIVYPNVINKEAWPSYSCTRSPKSYK